MTAYGISHTADFTEAFLILDEQASRDFLDGASEKDIRWIAKSADDLKVDHIGNGNAILRNVYAGLDGSRKFTKKAVLNTEIQAAIMARLNDLKANDRLPVFGAKTVSAPKRVLEACEYPAPAPMPVAVAAKCAPAPEESLEFLVERRNAMVAKLAIVSLPKDDGEIDYEAVTNVSSAIASLSAKIKTAEAKVEAAEREERQRREAEERSARADHERRVALEVLADLGRMLVLKAERGDTDLAVIEHQIRGFVQTVRRASARRGSANGNGGSGSKAHSGPKCGAVAAAGTKKEMILNAMARPQGLSIRECMDLAGWGASRNGSNGMDATSAARAQMGGLRRSGLYGITTAKDESGEVRYYWDGTVRDAVTSAAA